MAIYIYISNVKNSVGDMYKSIIEELPNKNDNVIILPDAYKDDIDFCDFKECIVENISTASNKFERWRRSYLLSSRIKKYGDEKVYIHLDCMEFCICYYLLADKFNVTLWLHDPVLHEGEPIKSHIRRKIADYTYISRCNRIIVSYSNIPTLLKEKFKDKLRVLPIPYISDLKFPDLKENVSVKAKYDFIFFGRLEPYKGLDLLLEAFQNERLKDRKLLIVGSGSLRNYVKLSIKNFRNITFIDGYIPNRDLAQYITESNYAIFPYISATGTSTVQVVNYYSKLVLATPVGCFSEYIKSGKNGFFIKECSVDAIIDAALNIEKIKYTNEVKKNIESEFRKFDASIIAKRLANIINYDD